MIPRNNTKKKTLTHSEDSLHVQLLLTQSVHTGYQMTVFPVGPVACLAGSLQSDATVGDHMTLWAALRGLPVPQ